MPAPFHCGTQYADWTSANCDRCTKSSPAAESFTDIACLIERALAVGVLTGNVGPRMMERCGAAKNKGRYQWPCPEWVPTEEWKRECLRRDIAGADDN